MHDAAIFTPRVSAVYLTALLVDIFAEWRFLFTLPSPDTTVFPSSISNDLTMTLLIRDAEHM